MAGDIQVRKNTNASVAEGLVNTFAAAGFEFADDDFLSGGYDKVQSMFLR